MNNGNANNLHTAYCHCLTGTYFISYKKNRSLNYAIGMIITCYAPLTITHGIVSASNLIIYYSACPYLILGGDRKSHALGVIWIDEDVFRCDFGNFSIMIYHFKLCV